MEKPFALFITKRQIPALYSALMVYERECEQAIQSEGYIDEDEDYTNKLLTVMELVEEAKILRGQLILRFGQAIGNED